MIKIMWFLKRADQLTLDEFHRWWLEAHAPAIMEAQQPYLKNYVINLRWPDDRLPARPPDEMDRDGVAEQ